MATRGSISRRRILSPFVRGGQVAAQPPKSSHEAISMRDSDKRSLGLEEMQMATYPAKQKFANSQPQSYNESENYSPRTIKGLLTSTSSKRSFERNDANLHYSNQRGGKSRAATRDDFSGSLMAASSPPPSYAKVFSRPVAKTKSRAPDEAQVSRYSAVHRTCKAAGVKPIQSKKPAQNLSSGSRSSLRGQPVPPPQADRTRARSPFHFSSRDPGFSTSLPCRGNTACGIPAQDRKSTNPHRRTAKVESSENSEEYITGQFVDAGFTDSSSSEGPQFSAVEKFVKKKAQKTKDLPSSSSSGVLKCSLEMVPKYIRTELKKTSDRIVDTKARRKYSSLQHEESGRILSSLSADKNPVMVNTSSCSSSGPALTSGSSLSDSDQSSELPNAAGFVRETTRLSNGVDGEGLSFSKFPSTPSLNNSEIRSEIQILKNIINIPGGAEGGDINSSTIQKPGLPDSDDPSRHLPSGKKLIIDYLSELQTDRRALLLKIAQLSSKVAELQDGAKKAKLEYENKATSTIQKGRMPPAHELPVSDSSRFNASELLGQLLNTQTPSEVPSARRERLSTVAQQKIMLTSSSSSDDLSDEPGSDNLARKEESHKQKTDDEVKQWSLQGRLEQPPASLIIHDAGDDFYAKPLSILAGRIEDTLEPASSLIFNLSAKSLITKQDCSLPGVYEIRTQSGLEKICPEKANFGVGMPVENSLNSGILNTSVMGEAADPLVSLHSDSGSPDSGNNISSSPSSSALTSSQSSSTSLSSTSSSESGNSETPSEIDQFSQCDAKAIGEESPCRHAVAAIPDPGVICLEGAKELQSEKSITDECHDSSSTEVTGLSWENNQLEWLGVDFHLMHSHSTNSEQETLTDDTEMVGDKMNVAGGGINNFPTIELFFPTEEIHTSEEGDLSQSGFGPDLPTRTETQSSSSSTGNEQNSKFESSDASFHSSSDRILPDELTACYLNERRKSITSEFQGRLLKERKWSNSGTSCSSREHFSSRNNANEKIREFMLEALHAVSHAVKSDPINYSVVETTEFDPLSDSGLCRSQFPNSGPRPSWGGHGETEQPHRTDILLADKLPGRRSSVELNGCSCLINVSDSFDICDVIPTHHRF